MKGREASLNDEGDEGDSKKKNIEANSSSSFSSFKARSKDSTYMESNVTNNGSERNGNSNNYDESQVRPALRTSINANNDYFSSSNSNDDADDDTETWISWFCALQGHQCFAEIDDEYIRDSFNLFGLRALVQNYESALEMILGAAPDDDDLEEQYFVQIYRHAMDLYGLIHARYIISPRGLAQMRDKYLRAEFECCPRVLCGRYQMLPLGINTDLHLHRIRMYCPKCQEVYEIKGTNDEMKDIDGAYFGPSFPHIFLQTFVNMVPLDPPDWFEPKIFGLKVHKRHSIVQIKLEKGEYGLSVVPAVKKTQYALSESKEKEGNAKKDGAE